MSEGRERPVAVADDAYARRGRRLVRVLCGCTDERHRIGDVFDSPLGPVLRFLPDPHFDWAEKAKRENGDWSEPVTTEGGTTWRVAAGATRHTTTFLVAALGNGQVVGACRNGHSYIAQREIAAKVAEAQETGRPAKAFGTRTPTA